MDSIGALWVTFFSTFSMVSLSCFTFLCFSFGSSLIIVLGIFFSIFETFFFSFWYYLTIYFPGIFLFSCKIRGNLSNFTSFLIQLSFHPSVPSIVFLSAFPLVISAHNSKEHNGNFASSLIDNPHQSVSSSQP